MKKNTYKIKGMHCASCAQIITRKLKKEKDIESVNINYASEEAVIAFKHKNIELENINKNLLKIGYSLEQSIYNDKTLDENNKLTNKQRIDLFIAVPLAVLIFLVMIYELISASFNFLPMLAIPMMFMDLFMFLGASFILFGPGRKFLQSLLKFFRYGNANMDTLIGLGTSTAYFYSLVIFIFPSVSNSLSLPEFHYFDATIVVIGFVILGKHLEKNAKQRSGAAIKELMSLQADIAIKKTETGEEEIPLSKVAIGDNLIIKPGMKVPVDGKVQSGESSVDQSMINGEPMPVDKKEGDSLIGGTINKEGYLIMRAEKIGSDTVLAKIIKMVHDTQNSRAPIQKLSDKISRIFVPVVIAIALISFFTWLFLGTGTMGLEKSLSLAISSLVGVLVIACPCALGLATPTALMVSIGKGAKKGILIKNAEALEKLKEIDTIVIDKTGTITEGKIIVSDIFDLSNNLGRNKILSLAAAIEQYSEHPLAKAIVNSAKKEEASYIQYKVDKFESHSGQGVSAKINNKKISLYKSQGAKSVWAQKKIDQGDTLIDMFEDGNLIAHIACSDKIKKEAKSAIDNLQKKGLEIIMITGDRLESAQKIASLAGIKKVQANVMPSEKAQAIIKLQSEGKKVAMIGDGINDAPALAQSDSGIAMATGTDVALATADITLMGGDLNKISQAFSLSKYTFRAVKENLFWASVYNLIGIPLAAGVLYPFFGIILNPAFAGAAMAMSSVSVVLNSLKLNLKKM